jgi:hypothetical protein
MPRILKSVKEANEMNNRHCNLVSSSKNTLPFSHTLTYKHLEKYDEKLKVDNIHLGQRKLLLSEIQLLTTYYKKNKEHPIVCYLGSAPGSHLLFLSYLFPFVKFILFDGSPMDPKLKLHKRYELHNAFFTDDVCREIKDRKLDNLLLISDIRLGSTDKTKFEDQVSRDNELQLGWLKILKPKYSLMKFRLPYTLKHGQSITYVKGKIMMQVWPPKTSGETRLLVTKANINKTEKYDFKSYEESLFFHNKYTRSYCFPKSIVPEVAATSIGQDYCTCYDCMGEIYTFTDYLALKDNNHIGKTLKFADIVKESKKPVYGIKTIIFGRPKDIEIIDQVIEKSKAKK